MNLAILDKDHNVVPTNANKEWNEFFEDRKKRVVKQDEINGILVSTVFLGMDHGMGGMPMWFETMVFEEKYLDVSCQRYRTWREAVIGHEETVKKVKGEQNDKRDGENHRCKRGTGGNPHADA